MSGEAPRLIPGYTVALSGEQQVNFIMDEMYRAPTIAAERTLQLDMIRRFQPNVPEYQGEEPWPMGSKPNETAVQALARQRREYRESVNDDDRTMGPAEIIDMHERQAYRFDDDEGSRTDDDHQDTSDDEALMRDMGAALNAEFAELQEDPSPDALPRIREIFVQVYSTLEELEPEDHHRVLGHFINTVEARYCRTVRRAYFDFAAALQAVRLADAEAEREAEREADREELRAKIWGWEREIEIWRNHLQAANTLFNQAFRNWAKEDPQSAKKFTQHMKNAGIVTTNGARLTSIMMWFEEVPGELRATRSRLARCFNKLAVLRHDIKIAEIDMLENEVGEEGLTQEMKDYMVSEDFDIGEQLRSLKVGRYGYETMEHSQPDSGPYTALSALYDKPNQDQDIERIQASLAIRWARLRQAHRRLSMHHVSHLRVVAAIWNWTQQALGDLETQFTTRPELIGALANAPDFTPVQAAWVNVTWEAKALGAAAMALDKDYSEWRRNGCVEEIFMARRFREEMHVAGEKFHVLA